MQAREEILLLGEDHSVYGEYVIEASQSGNTACVLSVGADPDSPGLAFKEYPDIPNEDACLAVLDGSRSLLAVADAHFGHESSHEILHQMSLKSVPANLGELLEAIRECGRLSDLNYRSETTLLVVVHDREAETLFGASFGDSSFLLVGRDGAHPVMPKTSGFVSPIDPQSLRSDHAQRFQLHARSGYLACLATDGVDECHYRSPETSVRPAHQLELFASTGPDVPAFSARLAELALHGVEGNPGGQDNIAIVTHAL